MKTQLIIVAVLVALAGCSKSEEGSAGNVTMAEEQARSVSHAKPDQVNSSKTSAQPERKNKPSELDRLLREGAQEKRQGLGRLDRKRGE